MKMTPFFLYKGPYTPVSRCPFLPSIWSWIKLTESKSGKLHQSIHVKLTFRADYRTIKFFIVSNMNNNAYCSTGKWLRHIHIIKYSHSIFSSCLLLLFLLAPLRWLRISLQHVFLSSSYIAFGANAFVLQTRQLRSVNCDCDFFEGIFIHLSLGHGAIRSQISRLTSASLSNHYLPTALFRSLFRSRQQRLGYKGPCTLFSDTCTTKYTAWEIP